MGSSSFRGKGHFADSRSFEANWRSRNARIPPEIPSSTQAIVIHTHSEPVALAVHRWRARTSDPSGIALASPSSSVGTLSMAVTVIVAMLSIRNVWDSRFGIGTTAPYNFTLSVDHCPDSIGRWSLACRHDWTIGKHVERDASPR